MTTEKKQERCSARILDSGGWHHYQCQKKATVERDGKLYCTIHDPEYIKAKREKQEAEWEAERIRKNAQWARQKALVAATEGLTTEELQALTPSLCRAAPAMYEALRELHDFVCRYGGARHLANASPGSCAHCNVIAKSSQALVKTEEE